MLWTVEPTASIDSKSRLGFNPGDSMACRTLMGKIEDLVGGHLPILTQNLYRLPMRTVVYPGSFDPITNGHLDVVQRAAKMFDQVILAVANNETKHPLFSLEERKRMALSAVSNLSNVVVETLEGLLVDYVVRHKACAVVRGLRAVSDFEFEFQLALMNRKLNENVETVFLMPKDSYSFLSSRLVKEVARLKGDVSPFVSTEVVQALRLKLNTSND